MIVATIGGVTVGLAVLIKFGLEWWPGVKAFQAEGLRVLGSLLPFLIAWCYGALAILTVGGLIGFFADGWLWLNNWLGDAALVWGVGGNAGSVPATGRAFVPLTQTGGAVVLLLTVGVLVGIKRLKCGRELKLGMWCGVCLCTSAGIAGTAAVPLAQGVNRIGDLVYGALA